MLYIIFQYAVVAFVGFWTFLIGGTLLMACIEFCINGEQGVKSLFSDNTKGYEK